MSRNPDCNDDFGGGGGTSALAINMTVVFEVL